MKPLDHALRSVKKYGVDLDEVLRIHEFFDQTKAAHADMRHRAILHNSMGCFLAVQVFGDYIEGAHGPISVRQIAEDHIMEDMGRIPNVSEFISLIPIEEASRFAYAARKRRTLLPAD